MYTYMTSKYTIFDVVQELTRLQLQFSIYEACFWKNEASSVTEEHGALRHILCRGPFVGGPNLKISVPFWESKIFSGHTTIFPKDENFFPETPTMFIATVDVYLL
jgi:hypothetical protein